ncbi:MlaD family protein [Gordonia sp. VNK21]|uniref:MlaD family protein n=1 Tax=Gordonia sp. VNK21 TaxID=3382483 RepID=UPI0038D4F5BA
MLKRSGRTGALFTAVVVVLLVIGAAIVYVRYSDRDTRALCAELPDSAGLYPGNAVNIRGVKVGEVKKVSPSPGKVTVEMAVRDRPLSAGMKVVAVNNSVLADRRLELVDVVPHGGAELPGDRCVTRAYTPISVSTAFQSFTDMFDEIGGAADDSAKPVTELIEAADSQFEGAGPDLSRILTNLSGFMSDPDEFLSQMRTVFDNLAVLTDVAGNNWDALEDIGRNAADLTYFMGKLFESFIYIFDGLGESGPGLDHLLTKVATPMLDMTDDFLPVIQVGLDRVDDLTAMLKEMPGIAKGIQTSLDRKTGGLRIGVRGPSVVADTPDAATLCRMMNAADAGSCDPRG